LPPWKPFYLFVEKPSQVLPEIAATPLVQDQDDVAYSDLNFITLAAVIEELTTETLDAAFARLVQPLNLASAAFNPGEDLKPRIAASEKGNLYELNTCREMFPDMPVPPNVLRERMIWGEVHDGNAWFMNGVAGHAGLFSTVADVLTIAQQFLPDHTTLLKSETCELFRTNFTLGMNEARSYAFQLAETPDSTAGSKMSPQSFGHLGFTGTSLWVDPIRDRVFILLTNRTHAHPLPFVNINSVRRRFHDLAYGLLDKQV
jgi:CubicO group peptidase (beta-lactamase class C family)